MKNELINISGFNINEFPFKLRKIGDLMYFEGPLMSVYSDSSGNAFIFDWVDSDEKNNRWLVYQVEKNQLSEYINNKISHFNLLNNPVNDLIFVIDKNPKGEIERSLVCSPNKLPYEYLPDTNIKFEVEDSKEIDSVILKFELNSPKEKNTLVSCNKINE